MQEVSRDIKAYAKVNLFLHITGLRDDGYHLLDTLMCRVDVADTIKIEPCGGAGGWRINCPSVPELEGEDNLCLRAARALEGYERKRTDIPFEGIIHLAKNIPVGAGMGGGSSDAAGVLRTLVDMYAIDISSQELERTALSLGADVPFFLRQGAWRLGGTGEKFLEQVKVYPAWLVILFPNVGISSAWAYKAFDKQNFSLTTASTGDRKLASLSCVYDIVNIMKNDLEAVVEAEFPVVGECKALLNRAGAVASMMTGSGSAVFGVFESEGAAGRAVEFMGTLPKGWRVVAARLLGTA